MFALPAMKNVFGNVQMCTKPLKQAGADEKKKPEKKKQEAKPKEEKKEAPKKKEEKPKDNVQSLPESSFDLYNFKTLYVNHADKKGAGVDTWYEMLDWEGWSFWRLEYEIYEDEGAKTHICNNLMGGFLSRAEHTSKYTFGRHAVLGEEPNL